MLTATVAYTLIGPHTARADEPYPQREYRLLRDEENWAWLRAKAPADLWDPVKYVRLARGRDDLFLTLGGEAREWLENSHNELWGQTGYVGNGALLQRYMLHADARLTSRFRVFAQIKSGLESFRKPGPGPVDKDVLDVNALFLDVVPVPGATLDEPGRLVLRVGRQEMAFGSGRFIDVREAPNVRFGYDGFRVIARSEGMRLDLFAVRPALTKPAALDDGWDKTQAFWGAWATIDEPSFLIDGYYLGRERDSVRYQRGVGKEWRHTLGGRARGRWQAFEAELEAAYQLGSFGDVSIRAWTVASEFMARGQSLPLAPQVTLGAAVTSGDSGSGPLGTFTPMFPRGSYFGLLSANGPSNDIGGHAALALSLPLSLTLTNEFWDFWRTNLDDGVYSVPGFLLRTGSAQQARYLGAQWEAFVTWRADAHFSLNGTIAHFWTGAFFHSSLPGRDITYIAAWAGYKF